MMSSYSAPPHPPYSSLPPPIQQRCWRVAYSAGCSLGPISGVSMLMEKKPIMGQRKRGCCSKELSLIWKLRSPLLIRCRDVKVQRKQHGSRPQVRGMPLGLRGRDNMRSAGSKCIDSDGDGGLSEGMGLCGEVEFPCPFHSMEQSAVSQR